MARYLLWCNIVVSLLVIGHAGPATGAQPCFSEVEIKQFLADGPDIIQWFIDTGRRESLNKICQFPEAIRQYPEIQKQIEACGWESERFAYILSRLVVGYKSRKIGSNADQAVTNLKSLKTKVNCSPKLAEPEKEKLSGQIDQCIIDIQHTSDVLVTIPFPEKRLMYKYRKELSAAFEERLPLRPIAMPNLQ